MSIPSQTRIRTTDRTPLVSGTSPRRYHCQMPKRQRSEPTNEMSRQLDKSDDPTLIILRAHLLIEERLRDILAGACRSPDELGQARLSFYQIFCLCRAIVGRSDEPAWAFVERLNTVRNRMAHHLDPGDLDELVGSVAEKLYAKYAGTKTALERFRFAADFACGYFDSLRGSVRLRPAYADQDEV